MCPSFYHRHIAPYVVHSGCSRGAFSSMREKVIPLAAGTVVEIGFGSGLNLPFYDAAKVSRLIGIDPDEAMLGMARQQRSGLPLEIVQGRAESLPLDSRSADAAVVSYALCTIADPLRALAEIRRVLKPGGRLLFLEHGLWDRPWRRRVQERLNGPWNWLAAGCNINRQPLSLIEGAGFTLAESRQERFPASFWQLGLHYGGIATPR
jgi:SAM-dependent methyltransferase